MVYAPEKSSFQNFPSSSLSPYSIAPINLIEDTSFQLISGSMALKMMPSFLKFPSSSSSPFSEKSYIIFSEMVPKGQTIILYYKCLREVCNEW